MGVKLKNEDLHRILNPYIKDCDELKDSVTQDNVDGLIDFAEAFGVEQELFDYVTKNPNKPFWDFFRVIPEGLAPGDDGTDLLDDGRCKR